MDINFKNSTDNSKVYTLKDLGKINIILGKNGCGKSTILRSMEESTRKKGHIKYIPPERGGALTRDGNFETNMQNENWINSIRLKNRFDQFRQSAVAEFRNLETLVLREIEKDKEKRLDLNYTFDDIILELNGLLENIEIVRSSDAGFLIKNTQEEGSRVSDTLSSGEAELISLGIEILSYAYATADKRYLETENWLLFDEPDVHLHPDLQHRLMQLLVKAIKDRPIRAIVATHSTSIVSALAEVADTKIAFMKLQQGELRFDGIDASLKAIMPIFGAHPLSNVFNNRPILLVEGEDDERIWQQACRSSQGRIKVWPCVAGDIQSLNRYELKAKSVLEAVYEKAVAYSLRDRDDNPYEIDDLKPVLRARLNCRSAENLIVADDVLSAMGVDWPSFQRQLEQWMETNGAHSSYEPLRTFRDGNWDRRNADLKPLRNVMLAIAGCQKPWEVLVGQSIALLKNGTETGPNSIADFLGTKLVTILGLRP